MPRQQDRRRVAQPARHLTHRDLSQFNVVHPDLVTVADNLLLERRVVIPAEAVRALYPKRSRRLLQHVERLIEHDLVKSGREALHILEKATQIVRASLRGARYPQRDHDEDPEQG